MLGAAEAPVWQKAHCDLFCKTFSHFYRKLELRKRDIMCPGPAAIPVTLRAECLQSLPPVLQCSSHSCSPLEGTPTGNRPLSPEAASLVCCRSHGHFCPVYVSLPQMSPQPHGCSRHTHTSTVHPALRFPGSQHPMPGPRSCQALCGFCVLGCMQSPKRGGVIPSSRWQPGKTGEPGSSSGWLMSPHLLPSSLRNSPDSISQSHFVNKTG